MNHWCPETKEYLEQKKYQLVIEFYEREIIDNPDKIINYWYLGLSYLLNRQYDEGKITWFLVINQAEEVEQKFLLKELSKTLEKEAGEQRKSNSYFEERLIRTALQEIAPQNVNNLLYLVNLGFVIEEFNLNYLREWGLIDLIKSNATEYINQELLKNVLNDVLRCPCPESMLFAEAVLEHTKGDKTIINSIATISQEMMYDRNNSLFSLDLIRQCLKSQPNNIYLLQELFWKYRYSLDYENSLNVAHKIDKLVPENNILLNLYSKSLYLAIYLICSDWINYQKVVDVYKSLVLKITKDTPLIKENFVMEKLLITGYYLLYLQDNLQENRLVFNKISYIFQKYIRNKYCCPVHFHFPKISITEKKVLKIGYIAHTLKAHSVGFLSRWLIHHHNQEKFPVHLYLINQSEDYITEKWFRGKAKQCHNLHRNFLNIIKQIESDEIDILVDLDSVTFNLTNMVMAAKPAPIQATWLGLDASGIPAIDYFIADNYVLPENADDYYQEKIWRLPQTYLAVDGFEVGVPDITRNDLEIDQDAVIFFNMQGALKRNPVTIHSQMKVIHRVPNSYLLIKGLADDKCTQELFQTIAEKEGVDPHRLRFLPRSKTEAIHRANIAIADVVLDTYPYNGATTTLETLWMGVPLVTRVGEQFAARNSYTFMINAGITEGIAWSEEEYIDWGIKFGTDKNLREEVKWKLKKSRQVAPVWNAKEFTRQMESAYEQMWNIYIQSKV